MPSAHKFHQETMSSNHLRHRKRSTSKDIVVETTANVVAPNAAAATDCDVKDERSETDGPYHLVPLTQRSLWLARGDVGPFVVGYGLLIATDFLFSSTSSSTRLLVTILFALTLLLQFSIVLLCQWNVAMRANVAYQRASWQEGKMNKWTHCLVQSSNNTSLQEVSGIVPISLKLYDSVTVAEVSFHNTYFRCCFHPPDEDVKLWQTANSSSSSSTTTTKLSSTSTTIPRFRRLCYPVDLPLSFYAAWKGHATLAHVTTAARIYGPNTTILQLPAFWDLLSEQIVAPFFIFQIFCVVLWSLDEYWYYALFTLAALFLFESTVAYNRLNGLQRLHRAGQQGQQRVWVRRGAFSGRYQWIMVTTKEVVPGDVISLTATAEGMNVPADVLLLTGSAVCDEALLTGESVPQLKQALDPSRKEQLDMTNPERKESILFGGTFLLVSTPDKEESGTDESPPDNGVVGMVLRTGFDTAQGNLLRTMAHTSKNADGVHTWDTFVFIFILVCCAFVAAALVLVEGWYDERRNRFRLVLHVVIIVTSVVPPELPMELSLAVTNSVTALMQRCQVYCTELFRIPWAGEVDICCFDKTGTLTSDLMQLRGVRVFDDSAVDSAKEDDNLILSKDKQLAWSVVRIMAACHSLAISYSKSREIVVIGDPLEQTVLNHSGFELKGGNRVVPTSKTATAISQSATVTILHRFAFSSKLRRMTVLACEGEVARSVVWALTKGAPEALKSLLRSDTIPSTYDDVAYYHMSLGRRVLAMAFKEVGSVAVLLRVKEAGRECVEKDLIFAGFLVLDCPLKSDSRLVINQLRKSLHDVVMITGDALLTAVEVARRVNIVPDGSIVYQIRRAPSANGFVIRDVRSAFQCVLLAQSAGSAEVLCLDDLDISQLARLVKEEKVAFCIAGDDLGEIASAAYVPKAGLPKGSCAKSMSDEKQLLLSPSTQAILASLLPIVSVFGRHAPHQKEAVIAAMNYAGRRTLMCGDGTNDVGALKRAHVGISIISAPGVESKQRIAADKMKEFGADDKRNRKNRKKGKLSTKKGNRSDWEESLRQLKDAQAELDSVELGDASVAAPFTSRSVSIKCCKDVIQQGRCTLVTMLQIYKILGINCLVNAMILSKLFLHGVKQGDRQLTILGVMVAALFYFVTRAEPLAELSPTRPPSSVLCAQALVSITLQFAIHFAAILIATYTALLFVDPYDPSLVPDGPFNPNVLNTCTFLLSCLSTINTFAVNYRGRPFMKDLHENRLLVRSLQICYAVLILCASEAFPPLNDLMQLSPLPELSEIDGVDISSILGRLVVQIGFPTFLLLLMAADTLMVFAAEKAVIRYM